MSAYRRYADKVFESIYPTMMRINDVKREKFIVRIKSNQVVLTESFKIEWNVQL